MNRFDYFYRALEKTADTIEDFAHKQTFLNTVYEQFFRGFSIKIADTHGIVYTPQSIVNFMVRSVEEILNKEFGKSLSSPNVHILDPFVGTGNFMVRVMREIKRTALEEKYKNELHCNEVMLLPYYIASMNIEHEFFELSKTYQPFEGICLVDTFELAEGAQSSLGFMTAENTARVERQRQSPIFVCIGNPPYNVGQLSENDNNKNRKYEQMDRFVAETYAKGSKATNKNKLNDPYVKAFRWASNRINQTGEGVVAFVTNSSYIHKGSFDGMRKHLAEDFDRIFILDLKGDIRSDSMRDGISLGEKHTVFGSTAMVGISIAFLVKGKHFKDRKIFYNTVDFRSTRVEKFKFLEKTQNITHLEWQEIKPDSDNNWLNEGVRDEFKALISIGSKEAKAGKADAIFALYSLGVNTNRDNWVFNFNSDVLCENIEKTINFYNEQVSKWLSKKRNASEIDKFVVNDDKQIKWSSKLKQALLLGIYVDFDENKFRQAAYRPFTTTNFYFDDVFTHRKGQNHLIFPNTESEKENQVICIGGYGRKDFALLICNKIPDLNFYTDPQQSFPFYVYNQDGTNRRENITDWALHKFREHYANGSEPGAVATGLRDEENPVATAPGSDPLRTARTIAKRDIFNYVYALLHHQAYREKYAANLKRELPRIPFAPDFWAFVKAGERLAALHLDYERQPEYPLEQRENPAAEFTWIVTKMRLSKDKTELRYNNFLTLARIPPETFEYKLGNRSALEWIIEQYQTTVDARSGIRNDPNRADNPQYILRLIKKIVTVSVETVKTIKELSALPIQ